MEAINENLRNLFYYHNLYSVYTLDARGIITEIKLNRFFN